jgi:hypothetical protein
LDSLLNLNNQQHPYVSDQDHLHKRPRLDPTAQMPTSYSDGLYRQDGQEKPPLGGQSGTGLITNHEPPGVFGGCTGSRLADCFASFSMCSTSDSQPCMCSYAAVSTRRSQKRHTNGRFSVPAACYTSGIRLP